MSFCCAGPVHSDKQPLHQPSASHTSGGGGGSRSARQARSQQRQAEMVGGSAEKIKLLFKKYGKIALGVHLCVYGTFLTGGW